MLALAASLAGTLVAGTLADPTSLAPHRATDLVSAAIVANVCATPGELSDHYDPRDKTLRLSEGVHDGQSIAALGIAAHEMGHAIQHAAAYKPLVLRQSFFPVASFASKAWIWLFIIGGFMAASPMGRTLMLVAAACLALYALFALITLPVEFDASRRAYANLQAAAITSPEESRQAKSVLDAAALTYLASAAVAVLNLLRLIALRDSRR